MELQVHESVLKKYHSIITVTFNLFCNSVDEIKQRTTSGLESSRSITSKFPLLCTGQNSSSPPSLLSGSIWLIPAGRVWPVWCVSLQWPGQDSPSTQMPPLWWLLKDLVLKWQSQRSRHFLHHWWWGAAAWRFKAIGLFVKLAQPVLSWLIQSPKQNKTIKWMNVPFLSYVHKSFRPLCFTEGRKHSANTPFPPSAHLIKQSECVMRSERTDSRISYILWYSNI